MFLIDYCRKNDYKIIFTTHIEKDSNVEFVEGSKNVELIDELHKEDFDVIVPKNKISPFFLTSLEQELHNIPNVVVAGILTNLCVRSFIQDAYDRDFSITVIKDCCVAFDDDTQEFTFKDLKATREEVHFQYLNDFIQSK